MAKPVGVILAVGVLIIITAPLALAGNPPVLNPVARPVNDAAGDGQEQANQKAQEVQDEAGRVQVRVTTTATGAVAAAQEAVGDSAASFVRFLGSAHKAAVEALDRVECYLLGCLGSGPGSDTVYGGNRYRIEADAVAPVGSDILSGVAMVVAASAVGGALLWVTVFQRGVALGTIPLLSRIAHSEIYTNEARRMIADIAFANPGLCLNEIVARTGYSRNAVSYHLFVLEKEDALVSIKDGKYRRYFPRGGKFVNGAKNVVSALRNETTLKMVRHIVARPGTIQRELCQVLGTTASAACWHAKRLETLGVIRKERVANTVQYFPGDELGRHDYSDFGLPAVAAGVPALVMPQ